MAANARTRDRLVEPLRVKPARRDSAPPDARQTGAGLKAIVDVDVEAKLREAMKAGVPAPLATCDLAADDAPLKKPTTRDWFATARNHVL
ncbi:MAG: hypothetical protein IPM17_03640 [Verrucomicrobia bacterium]|nr:hypothetical protein [Verrucomicrobiota bacterium]